MRKKASPSPAQPSTPAQEREVESHTVSSISEYSAIVVDQSEPKWFRGHGMADSYLLLPSLYRKRRAEPSSSLYELEYQMINRFRERSMPFVGDKFANQLRYDDLSILFYMQHYGIPTRLLDWTENPYVGLYFALNDDFNYDSTSRSYKEDACVWMLNPNLWNNKAIDCNPRIGVISVPNSDPVNGYLPKSQSEPRLNRPNPPIAITGFHNSPRIVAQRGVFMIYGADNTPMENISTRDNYVSDSLIKIVISKDNIDSMRTGLYNMGIADSVIYPDMKGFAAEIVRHFKL